MQDLVNTLNSVTKFTFKDRIRKAFLYLAVLNKGGEVQCFSEPAKQSASSAKVSEILSAQVPFECTSAKVSKCPSVQMPKCPSALSAEVPKCLECPRTQVPRKPK